MTAIDIEVAGYNINSGAGIIMASDALASASGPNILVVTNFVTAGNGNGMIDFNECNSLGLVLTNVGSADATSVTLILSTRPPMGLWCNPVTVSFIPVGGAVSNLALMNADKTGPTMSFHLRSP